MDARAAGISRRRFAAIGGLWRPQLTPTDSIRPYSTLPNRYSTTRKRIREAAAESSSSWSLGEYAVSIRSDFRSTASLPPRPQHAATLQDAIRLYSDHYNPVQAKCNLTRGKLRRARSNAPQRFEASSWASCRTTADASSFCESPRRPAPYPRRKDRDSSYVIPIAADLPRCRACFGARPETAASWGQSQL